MSEGRELTHSLYVGHGNTVCDKPPLNGCGHAESRDPFLNFAAHSHFLF